MKTLTKEEIGRLMKDRLQRSLAADEVWRATRLSPWDEDELADNIDWLNDRLADSRKALAACDNSGVEYAVDQLLAENNITVVAQGSPSYKILCRELLKVHIQLFEIKKRRAVGDYSDPIPELSSTTPVPLNTAQVLPANAPLPPQETGERLSVIIEKYAGEQQKVWTEKSAMEITSSLKLFLEILGDLPAPAIDAGAFRQFKESLLKLPPNMRKDRRYRKKTFAEIMDMNITDTIHPTTINKHIGRASALFDWAVKNGYMPMNPASKVRVPNSKKKKASDRRAIFTPDDLNKLFRSPAYLEDSHLRSHYFWIPIIGLFTGMRLSEIAQLHLEDIYAAPDGTYVIDVNDRPPRHLKNISSRRLVPLHDFLVNDLQLIQYVERLKAEGKTRLFPEINRGRDGYGHEVSKRFGRYQKRCGIPRSKEAEKRKDFHSFRHTVGNALRLARLREEETGELMGHSTGKMETYNTYVENFPPKFLKENVVDKLQYPGVDLSHLKYSRFATGRTTAAAVGRSRELGSEHALPA